MNKCSHNEVELSPRDLTTIFDKNYATILKWIGIPSEVRAEDIANHDKNTHYYDGKFPNAYKCVECCRIFVPYDDVQSLIKNMKGLLITEKTMKGGNDLGKGKKS